LVVVKLQTTEHGEKMVAFFLDWFGPAMGIVAWISFSPPSEF
jgi:hypothetical protein